MLMAAIGLRSIAETMSKDQSEHIPPEEWQVVIIQTPENLATYVDNRGLSG